MKLFEEVFLIQYLTVPTTTTEGPITDIVCFDPKLIIGALLCVGKNVVGVEDDVALVTQHGRHGVPEALHGILR